jgi:hypothetical protein
MQNTVIVQVINSESTVVSEFKKYEDSNNTKWIQSFHNNTMTYNEQIVNENEIQLYDDKVLLTLFYDPCSIYMQIDAGKRIEMFPECTFKPIYVFDKSCDDNEEIMSLLNDRLALGKQRYGHGVRIIDDTRQWGTDTDSWETMMMEEALDGMIYAAASILRIKKRRALANI